MRNKKDNLRAMAFWLAPSISEVVVYFFLGILTIILSNVDFIRQFIYAPANFSLKDSILDSVNSLLDRFVGVAVSRSAIVIIFWALVGLLVYMFIWLFTNFSDELNNDLALTKYVHPRNVDTRSPLKDFISKTIFRIVVFIILLFYISLFWNVLLPFCVQHFKTAGDMWPHMQAWKAGAIGLLVEAISLHVFIVFARFLFLKKRILTD